MFEKHAQSDEFVFLKKYCSETNTVMENKTKSFKLTKVIGKFRLDENWPFCVLCICLIWPQPYSHPLYSKTNSNNSQR